MSARSQKEMRPTRDCSCFIGGRCSRQLEGDGKRWRAMEALPFETGRAGRWRGRHVWEVGAVVGCGVFLGMAGPRGEARARSGRSGASAGTVSRRFM